MCSSRRRSSVAASGEGAGSGWWAAVGGGGLSSRPAVTPSRGPEPVGSPSPTPYQSCPNSFYGLPSAVLTVLPLLRRQNLAMGGSTRKLGAETLRCPWLGAPKGRDRKRSLRGGPPDVGSEGWRSSLPSGGFWISSFGSLFCVSKVTAERPSFGRSIWVRSVLLPEHRTRFSTCFQP